MKLGSGNNALGRGGRAALGRYVSPVVEENPSDSSVKNPYRGLNINRVAFRSTPRRYALQRR